MKYEPGQKVKVKRNVEYNDEALLVLEEKNYILTIASVHPEHEFNENGFYRMKEFEYMVWKDKYIECLYEEPQIPEELINSRFDILDL